MVQDRRITHYLALRKKLSAARAMVDANEGKKLAEYCIKMKAAGCPHPVVSKYTKQVDDGYGKWWSVDIEHCRICDKSQVPHH